MTTYFYDTETTGFDNPLVIEAASVEYTLNGHAGAVYTEQFQPDKPIELGAKATHHILESDLLDKRPAADFSFSEACPQCTYLIGHNVDYDWEVSGKPLVKRIDTLSLARLFWPKLDSHSQTALMYLHFGDDARVLVRGAHNAMVDVDNLIRLWEGLFLPQLKLVTGGFPSWEQIWEVSEDARIPRVMPFGKHKGLPVKQVPRDYVQWYLRQPDTDPYVVKALTGGK